MWFGSDACISMFCVIIAIITNRIPQKSGKNRSRLRGRRDIVVAVVRASAKHDTASTTVNVTPKKGSRKNVNPPLSNRGVEFWKNWVLEPPKAL